MSEDVLYRSKPVMFRSNPIAFVLCLILILAFGLGLLLLFVWWLGCQATELTITERKTTLRTGILSKHINEVWHRDVRNLQVSQGPLQRLTGVGNLEISSAGQGDFEISVRGMPDPDEIRALISHYRV